MPPATQQQHTRDAVGARRGLEFGTPSRLDDESREALLNYSLQKRRRDKVARRAKRRARRKKRKEVGLGKLATKTRTHVVE